MSLSVDDLVASMSSNHIGQEAMDLAALQVSSTPLLIHALVSLTRRHSGTTQANVVQPAHARPVEQRAPQRPCNHPHLLHTHLCVILGTSRVRSETE